MTKPNGRRQVRRKSKTELYNYLLEFYGINDNLKDITFAELYDEWISYKRRYVDVSNRKRSISPSTIRRYERDFEKYIQDTELARMSIQKITTHKLQLLVTDMIENSKMNEKCVGNILGYISQAFSYAKRSEYIHSNPTENLDKALLLSMCVYTPPKADSDRVLTIKELARLREAILRHEQEYPLYMPDYAIELVIGEPKNGKHRIVPITDDIRNLLNKIRALGIQSSDRFIFVRQDGTRYTAHDISCVVDRRASEAGIKKTSIHGIRRTVSSQLNTVLSQKDVSSMLGHSERVNERHYNYSTAENTAKIQALTQVSSKVINFSSFLENKKSAVSL